VRAQQRRPSPTVASPPPPPPPHTHTHTHAQRGKQRLQAEDGDKKTEREKLLGELRAIRDAARGPLSLEALDAKVAE
jgi:hypothetical protein